MADSDPEHEFEEALTKATPLIAAIGCADIAQDAWGGSPIPAGATQSAADDLHERVVAVR